MGCVSREAVMLPIKLKKASRHWRSLLYSRPDRQCDHAAGRPVFAAKTKKRDHRFPGDPSEKDEMKEGCPNRCVFDQSLLTSRH